MARDRRYQGCRLWHDGDDRDVPERVGPSQIITYAAADLAAVLG